MKIRNSILCALLVAFLLLAFLRAARVHRKPARVLCQQVFVEEAHGMALETWEDGPTVQQLGLSFVDDMVDDLVPRHSPMRIWAFDRSPLVRSVWQGTPATSYDLLSLQVWMHDNSVEDEGAIAAPTFARALAEARSAAARNEDVVAVVVSNGEWEDTDKISGMIANLATLPNVRAVVVTPISIEGDFRTRIEAALAPLGDRAIVANKTDQEQAKIRLRRLLLP